MPVTIKLSKLFHERLGEELANELVGWFNQVDATYRIDLKEFNELNFAWFDAKLDAKLDRVTAAEMFAKLGARITESEARMDAKLAEVRAVLERRLGEQTRWLVLTWATLLIPIVGLWFRG